MLARRWFSQYGEDRRLYSALGHIEHGRYVDIGAYEPEFHSVTKVFYDDGWRGTNVEPNPRAFALLEEQRPEDVNVKAVVTDRTDATLNLVDRRGVSSLRDDVAQEARKKGLTVTRVPVKCVTLAEVCEGPQIHFMKIDVEGTESEVIRSGDWYTYRPWVLVIEARFPASGRTVLSTEWESMVLDSNYVFRLDDGLNRWYTSREMSGDIDIGRWNVR